MNKIITFFGLLLTLTISATAQVASGGSYTLNQSVIGAGGGRSADAGNAFSLIGTIGEAVAGTTSSSGNFAVKGGFFAANALAPTAAPVAIGGRVLTPEGAGLRNALVTLTDQNGQTRTVMTGVSGSYRFNELMAGEFYIVSVRSKRYVFQSQVITANAEVTDLNFAGQPTLGGGKLFDK